MDLQELKKKTPSELISQAEKLGIENPSTLRKQEILFSILKKLADNNVNMLVNTSFNISKDPMVFDLFDVYTNMRRMNIEYIVMNDGIFKTIEI